MKSIVASDISEITAFQIDQRPVFKVKFRDGTFLVLKAEFHNGLKVGAVSDSSVLWAGRMMQQATPSLQVEILTQQEMNALRWVHHNCFQPLAVRAYLLNFLTGNTLYKMPYFQNLRVADEMSVAGKAGKLLGKLKGNAATLQGLGQVVAVDIFNGNYDRFHLDGGLSDSNLLFVKNPDKSYTAVGIDFYQAQGMASNLVADPPISRGASSQGLTEMNWGGPILVNDRTRMEYASKCIISLNNMFRKDLGHVAADALLGPIDAGEFANGLKFGAQNLRAYLVKEAAKGTLPPGVLTRMSLLNWAWSATPAPVRPGGQTPDKPGFTHKGVFFENRP